MNILRSTLVADLFLRDFTTNIDVAVSVRGRRPCPHMDIYSVFLFFAVRVPVSRGTKYDESRRAKGRLKPTRDNN